MLTVNVSMNRWLIRWIVGVWVNIFALLWSLYVSITRRDFLYASIVFIFFISSTNRELNILTPWDTSNVDTISKQFFSNNSFISFFRDFTNEAEIGIGTGVCIFCINKSSWMLCRYWQQDWQVFWKLFFDFVMMFCRWLCQSHFRDKTEWLWFDSIAKMSPSEMNTTRKTDQKNR